MQKLQQNPASWRSATFACNHSSSASMPNLAITLASESASLALTGPARDAGASEFEEDGEGVLARPTGGEGTRCAAAGADDGGCTEGSAGAVGGGRIRMRLPGPPVLPSSGVPGPELPPAEPLPAPAMR
eukprot:CAMPEP_0115452062 /NCGR_PEP_ID=MMETSP0271-20121206/42399_1 /TAXON_ID=71861 /ORGANISM="Scrippsiella trochoidea, Strain CCMP3099" /LENGTH=128 /DNA_ID=CAMNT_0002878375 /DNA_START=148 /DNA_END=532 /DNA_ORIENTATION=-